MAVLHHIVPHAGGCGMCAEVVMGLLEERTNHLRDLAVAQAQLAVVRKAITDHAMPGTLMATEQYDVLDEWLPTLAAAMDEAAARAREGK